MDPETRQLLLEAITLSKENNKMLHSMRNADRWSKAFTIIKYLLIIAVAFGAYVYLAPYLKNLTAAYNSILGNVQGLQNLKPF